MDWVPGQVRNDFTGFVGMKITVCAQRLAVTQVGRLIQPGNSGTHLVKVVDAHTLTDVAGGVALIHTAGGTAGSFKYESLETSVELDANGMYYLI